MRPERAFQLKILDAIFSFEGCNIQLRRKTEWGGNVNLRRIPTLFALVILAACAQASRGSVSIIPGDVGGINSTVRYVAADGVILLVIRGNPFTGTQEQAAAAVASAMRLPPGWPRASFASTPKAELVQGTRFVLVFNAVNTSLDVRELCLDPGAIEVAEPSGDTTWIMAAFCLGPQLGRGASTRGPAPDVMNPEFRALLESILLQIFALRAPRPSSMG